MFPLLVGVMAFLAIVGAGVVGFLFLRNRMLPDAPLKTKLPPSGARPWSRVRQGSIHGETNLYSQQTIADNPAAFGPPTPWATQTPMNNPVQSFSNASFAQSQNFPPLSVQGFSYSPQNIGWQQPGPAYSQPQAFPSAQVGGYPVGQFGVPDGSFQQPEPLVSPQQHIPSAAPGSFYPTNAGGDDIALALDSAAAFALNTNAKHRPAPVRLRSLNSSGKVAAMPDFQPQSDGGMTTIAEVMKSNSSVLPISPTLSASSALPPVPDTPQTTVMSSSQDSEELPVALDDPFLRDTLKRYIQNGNPDTP